MLKSYYEILNVSSTATKQEIKKQFKKLAKMYHPDVNSSLEAEILFKEITKAAEILLDDEKRKNYDLLRQDFTKETKNNEVPKYSYDDLFNKTQKKSKEKTNAAINGEDINISIEINYIEALMGCIRIVNIIHSEICPKCEGHKLSDGHICPKCCGRGEINTKRKITLKIPPSIKNKTKLRLQNEGNAGKYGGKNGNLYVTVNVEAHKEFEIIGNNIYYKAQISPYTAILGGDIKVPTLYGETTLTIPPLTKTNQSFKLVGVGAQDKTTGKYGDEIVKIEIQISSNLTDIEYRLYEKLREINQSKKNANSI